MNTEKLQRYRDERKRYLDKIAAYQERVKALEQKIVEGENLEIRAMMRDENISLDELMALVKTMQERRRAQAASIPAYTTTYENWEEGNE